MRIIEIGTLCVCMAQRETSRLDIVPSYCIVFETRQQEASCYSSVTTTTYLTQPSLVLSRPAQIPFGELI